MLSEQLMELIPESMRCWFDVDFCLSAVKQEGSMLTFVQNQTLEICLTAIRSNVTLIKYVKLNQLSSSEAEQLLREYQLLSMRG